MFSEKGKEKAAGDGKKAENGEHAQGYDLDFGECLLRPGGWRKPQPPDHQCRHDPQNEKIARQIHTDQVENLPWIGLDYVADHGVVDDDSVMIGKVGDDRGKRQEHDKHRFSGATPTDQGQKSHKNGRQTQGQRCDKARIGHGQGIDRCHLPKKGGVVQRNHPEGRRQMDKRLREGYVRRNLHGCSIEVEGMSRSLEVTMVDKHLEGGLVIGRGQIDDCLVLDHLLHVVVAQSISVGVCGAV